MLAKALIALVALAVILAVVVAMQPAQFRIERSAAMGVSPEQAFAQVNDFHRWEAWSPWLKADPQARTAYEGPAAGPGAAFRSDGNKEVARGA